MIISLLRINSFCLLLVLAGCASQTTGPIANPTFQSPDLAQVRNSPDAHVGQSIRWGGRITQVVNHPDSTDIQIVEQALNNSGRPRSSDTSNGRFIARFNEFLDPAIYTIDKPITIVGIMESTEQGTIGEHPYTFPVIGVNQHRLWPQPEQTRIIYYRDPFYTPFPRRFYPNRHRYPRPDKPKP